MTRLLLQLLLLLLLLLLLQLPDNNEQMDKAEFGDDDVNYVSRSRDTRACKWLRMQKAMLARAGVRSPRSRYAGSLNRQGGRLCSPGTKATDAYSPSQERAWQ